jgi:hypothetical protein
MWTAQNMGKYWSVRTGLFTYIVIQICCEFWWLRRHQEKFQEEGNTSPFEDPLRIWIGWDATLEETCHFTEDNAPQIWIGARVWSYYVDAHWELVITAIDISLLSEYLSFYSAVYALMMCCFWNGCGVFETSSRKYPVMRWLMSFVAHFFL